MLQKDKTKKRQSKTYNEQYNEEVQLLLLNLLLGDPEAFAISRSIIKEEYFDDKLQPAASFIIDYAEQYQKLPSVEMVAATTNTKVEKVSEADWHTSYILDLTEGFCQYKAMELAILDSVELLESGHAPEIVQRIKSAYEISLMSDLGTNYFGDPEARLNKLKDKSGYVTTGWSVLDHKLHGGFTRGGLNIFAGSSGSGKSLFLQNLAVNWALMGYNVAYISLELSEELVSLRLDSMIVGRGTSEVLRNVTDTVMKIRKVELEGKPGLLFVKKLPEGGTTVNNLRAYAKELQIKTGKKIDALIIDYLDLMYPINSRIDVGDHFIKDKFVSEDIRALMGELNVFGATASQLNRGAISTSEYDQSHIAGGISKINTADNAFAILTSLGMKEQGIYKLQFLKTRSASAQGHNIDLAYDTRTMRITDPVVYANVDTVTPKKELENNLKVEAQKEPQTPTSEEANDILKRVISKPRKSIL